MGFFSKIFGNKPETFDNVKVDREVIDSMIYYSKEAYPREFLSLLEGKIVDNTLYVLGLIFLPGETCDTGAVLQDYMIPPTLKYWGTAHCHPGPSARPSDADLATFSKHGVFHLILCLPYSQETFIGYNKHGELMEFEVGDYSYLKDNEDLDEYFYEDDVLDDGEELKPGFFDDEEEFNREFNSIEETNPKMGSVILPDFDEKREPQNVVKINVEIDENGNLKITDFKKRK